MLCVSAQVDQLVRSAACVHMHTLQGCHLLSILDRNGRPQ